MRNKVIGKILILALALVTIMGCISVASARDPNGGIGPSSSVDQVTIDDGGGSSGGSTGSTGHEHTWSSEYTPIPGTTQHGKKCTGCSEYTSKGSCNSNTTIDNGNGTHDVKCSVCGRVRVNDGAHTSFLYQKISETEHRKICGICGGYIETQEHNKKEKDGSDYHWCDLCESWLNSHHIFSGSDCIYCDAWIWINDFDMQGQLLYDFDYTMVGYSGGCTFPTFSSFVVKTDYTPYTSETTIAPLVVKAAAVTHGNFDFHYGSELQKYNEWATRWGEDESDFDFPVENIEREMSDWIGGHEDIEEIITGRIR